MVQQMANKMAMKLSEHSIIEAKSIHIYAYGLELLFSSLAGVIALIVISAVCEKPSLWIPYMAGFVPLRIFGGGYHARTHFCCVFIFSLLYSFILLIGNLCAIPAKIWLIVCFINLLINLLFSPVVASNKPLKERQRRMNRRNSLFLCQANLFGCILLVFLFPEKSQWVNMYFAGSSMAGLSMLLAVIINEKERRKLYESDGE